MVRGMRLPPEHGWLEMECHCCRLPRHVPRWRRLLAKFFPSTSEGW